MKTRAIFLIIGLSFLLHSSAQTALAQHSNTFSLSTHFLQLKEGLNQGMVFDGARVHFNYTYKKIFPLCELSYHGALGLGWGFSRGMTASDLQFVPAGLSCCWRAFKTDHHLIQLGGDLSANYNYQRYTDLQSGHLFWHTEIGLSIVLQYCYSWKAHQLNLTVTNSVLGLTSRPEAEPNPYFYSLKFVDYVKYAHSNLKLGSINQYDHSRLNLEYIPNTAKRHSISMGMDYCGYFYNPRFQGLSYYVQWNKTFTK